MVVVIIYCSDDVYCSEVLLVCWHWLTNIYFAVMVKEKTTKKTMVTV